MQNSLLTSLVLLAFGCCTATCADGDGEVVRRRVRAEQQDTPNLLRPDAWRPWEAGFQRQGPLFVCDNATQTDVQRGASQTVTLDQQQAEPIVARVASRCENVSGAPDSNYSLYLDLIYMDGTHLWGQAASFATGTHDWQQRQVLVLPEKPVRQVAMHLLLRNHSGKAWFREPELRELRTPAGATRFDGVPVVMEQPSRRGFLLRDVAADSDFVRLEKAALGVQLQCRETSGPAGRFLDVTLSDTTGTDRALTLVYCLPVTAEGLQWYVDPRRSQPIDPGGEHMNASRFTRSGANGRLSRYPLGCVGNARHGVALGIDMDRPALFRIGYHGGAGELFLAYDVALTPEKNTARLRCCQFTFDARERFRGALARYYELFPAAFACRTPRQGLWMPFAKISEVEGFADFGFQFKEGTNETAWDDRHEVLTFRYTEPMTWWMRMPEQVPRTLEAATQYARQQAAAGDRRAEALLTSGFRDQQGNLVARILDRPWCDGAVWSMNSMPQLAGTPSDFQLKWNERLRSQLYGPDADARLDGEYVDSSEGYVTDELDFDRSHFAASPTPLCFDSTSHCPAIFRGLIAHAYVRQIAGDVHTMDRLMMANSTPIRLCWLAPYLDVLGTETDWHRAGVWQPMSDSELLYRRAMCKAKPFCILMNTRFEQFSHQLVDKYMQRALAYGMFPGFFSHNASQGHYFTRPELYNRDRPLFKKYVPLCRRVAEAGWQPVTGATSSHPQVYVERFGPRLFTVFNDGSQQREVTVRFEDATSASCWELVRGCELPVRDGRVAVSLGAESVAVLEMQ